MLQDNGGRKVVTRSPGRKVGLINCRWFQDSPVEHESQLERRFVVASMLCQGLRTIQAQPFTLQLEGRRYTPDYLLSFGSTKVVVEVKNSRRLSEYESLFDAVAQLLARTSVAFFALTEAEIDFGDRTARAAEILRYAKSEQTEAELAAVVAAVPAFGRISMGQLEMAAQCTRRVILHAIALRILVLVDLDAPLREETEVALSEELTELEAIAAFEARFKCTPWGEDRPWIPERASRRPAATSGSQATFGPYVRKVREDAKQSVAHPLAALAGGL